MSVQASLLPVFVQIGLTYCLGLWMAKTRRDAFAQSEVRWQDIALKQRPWPEQAQKLAQAFQNQFEIPTLFYVLVAFAILTQKADLFFVILSWIFVATRIGHAYVFVTSNHVPTRGLVFIVGTLLLLMMWVIFALKILLAA
jgi:hypothetical protein